METRRCHRVCRSRARDQRYEPSFGYGVPSVPSIQARLIGALAESASSEPAALVLQMLQDQGTNSQ
jgi:hypothetical protein